MVQPHLFYGSYIHSRHRHLNGWYTSPPCERSHKNSLSPFHSEVNNLTTSHRKTVFSKECGSFKKTPRRIKKMLRRFTSNTEAFCPKHRNTSFLILLVNFNILRSESVKGAFRSSFHTSYMIFKSLSYGDGNECTLLYFLWDKIFSQIFLLLSQILLIFVRLSLARLGISGRDFT